MCALPHTAHLAHQIYELDYSNTSAKQLLSMKCTTQSTQFFSQQFQISVLPSTTLGLFEQFVNKLTAENSKLKLMERCIKKDILWLHELQNVPYLASSSKGHWATALDIWHGNSSASGMTECHTLIGMLCCSINYTWSFTMEDCFTQCLLAFHQHERPSIVSTCPMTNIGDTAVSRTFRTGVPACQQTYNTCKTVNYHKL